MIRSPAKDLLSARSVQPRCAGFTYLGVLFAVVIAGFGLASVATVWSTASQRDKEAQLLFAGQQFERAIASYFENGPGGTKEFPGSLADLLEDPRWPAVRRHLRRIYVDPMTGQAEWGLVKQGEQIVGVHSLSPAKPLKHAGFDHRFEEFAQAEDYTQWRFTYRPAVAQGQRAPGPGSAPQPGPVPLQPSPGIGVLPPTDTAQVEDCNRVYDLERRSCENRFRIPGSRAKEECLQRAEARRGNCGAG